MNQKDLDQLKKDFEKRFGKDSVFNKKDMKQITEKYKKLGEAMKLRTPVKSRFVQTEFSRFKIVMLKDNSIIINELKEDEANRLFDNIENAC